MRTRLFASLLLGLLSAAISPQLSAQGTAFSYHGRLIDNGQAANGTYDFRFTVYDALADGAAVGQVVNVNSVEVSAGLFTTQIDPGAAVFTGAPRWLEIGVRPAGAADEPTPLAPRQPLLPTPYAVYAGSAGGVASGTVTADQLNTGGLAPTPGQFLSYDGGKFTWTDPGVAAGNIWSLNGADAYYTAGNVGIGTASPPPGIRLDINGATVMRPGGSGGAIQFGSPNAETGMSIVGSGAGAGRADLRFDGASIKLVAGIVGGPPSSANGLAVTTNGLVGIGTTAPISKLDIVGAQNALGITGYQPVMTLHDSSAGYARGAIQSVGGDLNQFTESYLSGANPFAFIKLANSGNVGLGSSQPVGKLEVVAQDAVRMIGYQPFLTLLDSAAGYARSRIQGVNGELVLATEAYLNGSNPVGFVVLKNSGNLGLGVAEPQSKLDVNGTIRTKVLTITGGADVAEPFRMSHPEIPAGAVVVIDKANPGRLKLSGEPYDRKVAGIVSGANGVQPGITLHQEGLIEGDRNVALSGRVYVQADADVAPIEPGDLLTTSSRAGHAMKVADPVRAQGAILGKAMTALDHGQGLVLVLVTLQ